MKNLFFDVLLFSPFLFTSLNFVHVVKLLAVFFEVPSFPFNQRTTHLKNMLPHERNIFWNDFLQSIFWTVRPCVSSLSYGASFPASLIVLAFLASFHCQCAER